MARQARARASRPSSQLRSEAEVSAFIEDLIAENKVGPPWFTSEFQHRWSRFNADSLRAIRLAVFKRLPQAEPGPCPTHGYGRSPEYDAWADRMDGQALLLNLLAATLESEDPMMIPNTDEAEKAAEWLLGHSSDREAPGLLKAAEHISSSVGVTSIPKALQHWLLKIVSSLTQTHYTKELAPAVRAAVALGLPPLPLGLEEPWAKAVVNDYPHLVARSPAWAVLLQHCLTATMPAPTAKWRKIAAPLLSEIGAESFRATVDRWFQLLTQPATIQRDTHTIWFISGGGQVLLRGVVWCVAQLASDASACRMIAGLLDTCLKKVPGVGPRSLKVGNACIWALGEMAASRDVGVRDTALAQLSRLKSRVTVRPTLIAIERVLNVTAQRAGISLNDLEELGVPSFGFEAQTAAPSETTGDAIGGVRAEPPGDTAADRSLAELGLASTAGWLAALPGVVALRPGPWLALLRHLTTAPARPPAADLSVAQHEADARLELGADRPIAAPGTDGFAATIASAAPADDWLKKAGALVDRIGRDAFASAAGRLVAAATETKPGRLNRRGAERDVLRPLIWLAALHAESSTYDRLVQLGRWATANRTNQGPTVGLALGFAATRPSAAALRTLEQAAKRPSARLRFGRLAEHLERGLGLDADDVRERAVSTAGFGGGSVRVERLGGATATLRVEGNKVVISWTNEQGKPVKSPPAAVKRDFKEDWKELKHAAADAEGVLLAARDRLDNLYLLERSWKLTDWRERYLNHGLLGTLARRLIWTIDGTAVLFEGEAATDVDGRPVELGETAEVRLWHPVGHDTQEVARWRGRLAALGITQPFKQAHREVYLLTDAERTTRVYSNRFAAHVLRQHQMKALADARKWHYRLQGPWDGADSSPSKCIGAFDLTAQFWVQGIGAYGADTSTAGVFLHVATDQIRFYRGDWVGSSHGIRWQGGRREAEPVPLEEIPPLVFSEILRDCDLFVGVASVGNDPTWQDGGPGGRFRDYWQNYSFGDLSQTAQTRKAVLEQLVPRLKIASRCSFTDKFLVVRGDVRTYKIHLGSGNILMEPNDQYLCIVPDQRRSSTDDGAGGVLLPFEGDRTLSVILSKALMLAEDTRIRDATILSQIGRAR